MKIRIKGNSIRIRLTRTEVETFGREGYLEERTVFGEGNVFTYALARYHTHATLGADFSNGKITMLVPASMAEEWATSDVVGFSDNVPLDNGGSLFLLLEKDFKCIDGDVTEDQSDNYENPLHACE